MNILNELSEALKGPKKGDTSGMVNFERTETVRRRKLLSVVVAKLRNVQ